MTSLWNEGWRLHVRATQSSPLLVTNLCLGISDVAGVLARLVFSFSLQPVGTAGPADTNLLLSTTPVRGAHCDQAPGRGEDSEQEREEHLTELLSSPVV